MPEHLDAGINNGDDSFETWVSIVSNSGTEGGLEEFMLIKNQFFDYTFIRIRMTSKNIEVRGSNSIQESCISSVESTVPEHLDAGINNGDDSFETWVSAESEFDNTIDETWVSAESEFNNSSGDLIETSQSCVVTGSIPGFL